MGRATSGVQGMKFRDGDDLLSMSVIRASQVAAEAAAGVDDEGDSPAVELVENVKPQYVFTITDGGFAKRTRISDYRLQSRGGIGIKAMKLDNEERGNLVGAFIVVDGDEVLCVTSSGQVVRSPIDEAFRPTGRSTMGVKFVTPKAGDSVAVVARSVEKAEEVEEAVDEAIQAAGGDPEATAVDAEGVADPAPDATIGDDDASESPEEP
jgi:DNA gyrase subunit A